MKVFTGLKGRDKRINRIFGSVFFFAVILSIIAVLTTPDREELYILSGDLVAYKCEVNESSKDSREVFMLWVSEGDGGITTLSHSMKCEDRILEAESGSQVKGLYDYPLFGSNKILFELIVGNEEVLSYSESKTKRYMLPIGVLFVFGLPWALWAFIKVAQS